MTHTNGATSSDQTRTGQIVFLIGGAQPEKLTMLLGVYLGRPEVERVVLMTTTPAVAARVAAPYATYREEGRLATVLAGDDINSAVRAARRGWGDPHVTVELPLDHRVSPASISLAAD